VKVEFNNTPLWFLCTHLGCHSGPEQHAQSLELAEFIKELSADGTPVLLAGDTNSPPWFAAMRHLRNSVPMVDTWASANACDCSTTFPALGLPCCYSWTCCPPMLKLDHIYATQTSQVTCVGTRVHVNGDSEGGGARRSTCRRPTTGPYQPCLT
jgi:endonuclease/exonuclease/phosphatase family metal-dependent hydrolase